jgi:hypothetical protein
MIDLILPCTHRIKNAWKKIWSEGTRENTVFPLPNLGPPIKKHQKQALKSVLSLCENDSIMAVEDDDSRDKVQRPVCFGDEAKFVAYMENPGADSECGRCPSENECGEYIVVKWSWEVIF